MKKFSYLSVNDNKNKFTKFRETGSIGNDKKDNTPTELIEIGELSVNPHILHEHYSRPQESLRLVFIGF